MTKGTLAESPEEKADRDARARKSSVVMVRSPTYSMLWPLGQPMTSAARVRYLYGALSSFREFCHPFASRCICVLTKLLTGCSSRVQRGARREDPGFPLKASYRKRVYTDAQRSPRLSQSRGRCFCL